MSVSVTASASSWEATPVAFSSAAFVPVFVPHAPPPHAPCVTSGRTPYGTTMLCPLSV
jgi:hypothetical protein